VGMILGPPLLQFFKVRDVCALSFALITLGKIGVILLVLEAGLSVDILILKRIGVRGLFVALLGMIIPITCGYGILRAFDIPNRLSITGGSSLGPTSVGFAAALLKEVKKFTTMTGQLISTAAIIDDVVSLVILSEIEAISDEDSDAIDFVLPVLGALLFIGIFGSLALFVVPRFFPRLLSRIPARYKDEFLLGFMLLLLVAMTFGAGMVTSFLLGSFLTGLMLSKVEGSLTLYNKHIKHINAWLSRFFFSATIGFSVPLKSMFNKEALLLGFLLTLGSTYHLSLL